MVIVEIKPKFNTSFEDIRVTINYLIINIKVKCCYLQTFVIDDNIKFKVIQDIIRCILLLNWYKNNPQILHYQKLSLINKDLIRKIYYKAISEKWYDSNIKLPYKIINELALRNFLTIKSPNNNFRHLPQKRPLEEVSTVVSITDNGKQKKIKLIVNRFANSNPFYISL